MNIIQKILNLPKARMLQIAIVLILAIAAVVGANRFGDIWQRIMSFAGGMNGSISLSDATVAPGAEFEVPIMINTSEKITGVDLVIEYDKNVLQLVTVDAKPASSQLQNYLPQNQYGQFDADSVVQNAASSGRIEFGAFSYDPLFSGTLGPTNPLAILKFKALAVPGSTQIRVIHTSTATNDSNLVLADSSDELGRVVNATITIGTPVVPVLPAPGGITHTCSATGSHVDLKWNTVQGATKYQINVDDLNNGVGVDHTNNDVSPGTTVYGIGITAGGPYKWWVQAVNSAGVPSAAAGEDYIVCADTTLLPAPSGLTHSCNQAGNRLTVRWSIVSGAQKYLIRVDDTTNGSAADYSNDNVPASATSHEVDVYPDNLHRWWIHTVSSSGSVSEAAVEENVICSSPITPSPSPSPTPVVSPSPTPITSPSPAASPSPDPVVGDVTGDGVVNQDDVNYVLSKYHTNDSRADLNGNGRVEILDLGIVIENLGN